MNEDNYSVDPLEVEFPPSPSVVDETGDWVPRHLEVEPPLPTPVVEDTWDTPYQIADAWYPGEWVLFLWRKPCGHATSLHEAYLLCRKIEKLYGRRPTIVSPENRVTHPPLIRGAATRIRG